MPEDILRCKSLSAFYTGGISISHGSGHKERKICMGCRIISIRLYHFAYLFFVNSLWNWLMGWVGCKSMWSIFGQLARLCICWIHEGLVALVDLVDKIARHAHFSAAYSHFSLITYNLIRACFACYRGISIHSLAIATWKWSCSSFLHFGGFVLAQPGWYYKDIIFPSWFVPVLQCSDGIQKKPCCFSDVAFMNIFPGSDVENEVPIGSTPDE